MWKTIAPACTAVLLAATVSLQAQPAGSEDTWQPLRAFAGNWDGEADGQPGKGTSTRQYRFVMNGRFLEVRNKSTYSAQPKNPKGEVHEDWGMISFDRLRKKFVLRQFHVEGFVNQFVAEPGSLVFISEAIENIPAGFRARETYRFTGADAFTETFELAAPGKEFEVYSETQFRRRSGPN